VKEKYGSGSAGERKMGALIFPLPSLRAFFSQAWSQGATVGGLCEGKSCKPVIHPILAIHGQWQKASLHLYSVFEQNYYFRFSLN